MLRDNCHALLGLFQQSLLDSQQMTSNVLTVLEAHLACFWVNAIVFLSKCFLLQLQFWLVLKLGPYLFPEFGVAPRSLLCNLSFLLHKQHTCFNVALMLLFLWQITDFEAMSEAPISLWPPIHSMNICLMSQNIDLLHLLDI